MPSRRPAGMLEAGDSIRGWLCNLNVPAVCLVGYRGYTRHGVNKDSAATYTERFDHLQELTGRLAEKVVQTRTEHAAQ